MTDPNTNDDGIDRVALAQEAYNAYAQSVGYKAFNGDSLPAWSAVADGIKGAWVAAVEAVVDELQGGPPSADDLGYHGD